MQSNFANVKLTTQTRMVDAPQWAFKLNPDAIDANLWPYRQDKIENFYYYDPD